MTPLTHPAQKIDQVDSKIKSRVKKISVTRDQNSIFFLKVDPIPFLGLDLIDPRSSLRPFFYLVIYQNPSKDVFLILVLHIYG